METEDNAIVSSAEYFIPMCNTMLTQQAELKDKALIMVIMKMLIICTFYFMFYSYTNISIGIIDLIH